jgi:hypothetical protein
MCNKISEFSSSPCGTYGWENDEQKCSMVDISTVLEKKNDKMSKITNSDQFYKSERKYKSWNRANADP